MPQLFQVLKCYKCLVFQVHQVKKSNKWECKMCGEKQSVKRHYGLSTAKGCRLHVQKLNGIRGEVEEAKQNETDTNDKFEDVQSKAIVQETQLKKESRWAAYVEEIIPPVVDSNSAMYLNDTEVVLEVPQKRKRILGNHHKNKINKSSTLNKVLDNNPGSSVREESLCPPEISLIQKPQLKFNNNKNKITKCNQYNESIDSIKQNDDVGEYLYSSGPKPQSTFSVESYSSVTKELNTSKQIVKKFKPPTMNKNSKWAQFADDEEQGESSEDIESLTSPCVEQFWEQPEIYHKDLVEEIKKPGSACTIEQSHNKSNANGK